MTPSSDLNFIWQSVGVLLFALGARLYFRSHRLHHAQRVVLSCVAIALLSLYCLTHAELSVGIFCIIGFSAFVLWTSIKFLRRFESEMAQKK
jgi:uncharacterized membrane protein